jgi:acyl-CoA synthetase (NDP forming)
VIDPAVLLRSGVPLAEHQVKDLLASFGIPVPPRVVLPAGSALPPGELPFPYPVVLKVSDPAILHKTEVGGVRLGIPTRSDLEREVAAMRARFPHLTLMVEAQQPPGVEAIVGLLHDATFGPSLMVGLGGIFTEVYEDVAFRVVPIGEADAHDMIEQLRGARLFDGFRGMKASREALVSILLGVSRLGQELGDRIEQMDLNPVTVYAERAIAVDAKLRLR